MRESIPRSDRPPPAYGGPNRTPDGSGCLILPLALMIHVGAAGIGLVVLSFTEKTEGTGWWPVTTNPLAPYVNAAWVAWLVGLGAIVLLALPVDAVPHRHLVQLATPVGWLVLVLLVAAVVLIV